MTQCWRSGSSGRASNTTRAPRRPSRFCSADLGAEVYNLQPLTFDDEDRGFRRWSAAGSADWNEAAGGFGGHYWWTCAENTGDAKQNLGNLWAEWVGPRVRGTYEVQVFVPGNHASSRNVLYQVWVSFDDRGGTRFDQKPWSHQWVPLTTLTLGSEVHASIHSNTGESGGCASQIAADAIRLVPRAP